MSNDQITVKIPPKPAVNYLIHLGASIYDFPAWLSNKSFNPVVIITDHTVKKRYGLKLQKCLKKGGYNCLLLSFPPGEKFKTPETKSFLENAMSQHHCDRNTLIIALGGGVVGDLAGFIAATYLRGIPYIQMPTTLLAMVDSSVGGKTAVNTTQGKNLTGALWQPLCVIVDVTLLKSLSRKNRINGLIEAIKIFLTHDAESFYHTESQLPLLIQGDTQSLKQIISRAIRIKAAVVARDENEKGERSTLNFGHTIGHALEKLSGYRLLHGYAVAYGILVESTVSHLLGLLDTDQLLIIKKLIAQLGIHGKNLKKYELTPLIEATKKDKKVRLGKVHYTLLKKIGCAHITKDNHTHPVTDKIVRQAFKSIIRE